MMKTNVSKLADILRSSNKFVVPPFQRKYSWTTTQWDRLWEDILTLYARSNSNVMTEPHFMGALVYGEARSGGPTLQAIPEYEIIDGQQRLLTLSILIAAIRDSDQSDPTQTDFVNFTYLWHAQVGSRSQQLRLIPTQHDFAPYESIQQGNSPSISDSLIIKAYKYFSDKIRSGYNESVNQDLDEQSETVENTESSTVAYDDNRDMLVAFDFQRLLSSVTDSLVLVAISDVPTENAYQVFSTINADGLKLGQVDLLRNAVFMLLPRVANEVHATVWKPMEDLLGEGLQTFLLTDLIRSV